VDDQAATRSFSIVPERAAAAAARKVSLCSYIDGGCLFLCLCPSSGWGWRHKSTSSLFGVWRCDVCYYSSSSLFLMFMVKTA